LLVVFSRIRLDATNRIQQAQSRTGGPEMNKRILALTVLVLVLPCIGSAQSKEMLVGTWKLVSARNVTDKGIVTNEPYGRTFIGFLTYTSDGRMMAIITNGGRKLLSKGFFATPAEERAEAYSTMVAYAGHYTLNGDKVTHHVEASSIPNWVNTDLVRTITKLQSDRVTLRTDVPFVWSDGVQYAYQELTWDRMK
jgi:Lipocalin-like domain